MKLEPGTRAAIVTFARQKLVAENTKYNSVTFAHDETNNTFLIYCCDKEHKKTHAIALTADIVHQMAALLKKIESGST